MYELPSKKELRNLFSYSNGFLIRKIKRPGKHPIGEIVGNDGGNGYLRTKIKGRTYLVHRLIWCWHYGQIKHQVDHKNRIKKDNRIRNLRVANHQKNGWNTNGRGPNSTGFRNVSKTKLKCRNPYRAYLNFKGKRIELGLYRTARLAHAAYLKKAKALHGKFYAGN